LVLDDLHWAGPDAVDLLAALVTAAGSPPIRLTGAYRDSEAPARLGEFTADLARSSLVRVLPLGPLTDIEAERLLLSRFARDGQPTPDVLPAIVRRAGGVPFFLVSYAEELRESGRAPRSWRCPGRWRRSSGSGWPRCPARRGSCSGPPPWSGGWYRTGCWRR
jgi:predicted ATPase